MGWSFLCVPRRAEDVSGRLAEALGLGECSRAKEAGAHLAVRVQQAWQTRGRLLRSADGQHVWRPQLWGGRQKGWLRRKRPALAWQDH